jgi:hypothetical protein
MISFDERIVSSHPHLRECRCILHVVSGFVLTRHFHPTLLLAVIVTTSLVSAYAIASYLNHTVLIPRFWVTQRRLRYGVWLLLLMAILTAVALTILRTAYLTMLGPDPDPNGVYKHYAIDFFGMVVHVSAAAGVMRLREWWQKW